VRADGPDGCGCADEDVDADRSPHVGVPAVIGAVAFALPGSATPNLHYLSTQWIEHRQVDGKTTGRYIMDHIGTISPAP
jgi:hypothetical protein